MQGTRVRLLSFICLTSKAFNQGCLRCKPSHNALQIARGHFV